MSESLESPSSVSTNSSNPFGPDKFDILASIPSGEDGSGGVPSKIPLINEEKGSDPKEIEKNEKEELRQTDEGKSKASKEGEEEVILEEGVKSKQVKEETLPVSKGKVGEDEIEVPDAAVFTFKASKGEVSVPLSELKASYQSKAERDRLFGQFQKDKLGWEKDKQLVETQYNNWVKKFKENPWEVIHEQCSLFGQNPADVLPVFLGQAQKTLQDLDKLPEEERRIVFAKMGLEWQEKQLEQKGKKQEVAEKRQEAIEYSENLKKQHSITDEELDAAFQVIQSTPQIPLDKKSEKEVTDLLVGYIVEFERPYRKIEEAILKVDSKLNNDAELKKEIRALISENDSVDDVVDLVRMYIEPESLPDSVPAKVTHSQEPERKVSKPTPQKERPRKEEPRQTANNGSVILNLDDWLSDLKSL